MRILLALVVLSLSWTTSAGARDIYVSNVAGDDRHDGRATRAVVPGGGPVRTIAKALRLAEAGDRIVVENTGEPYREAISLSGSRHGGSALGPLVIDGGGATLDGTVPIPDDGWRHEAGDVFSYQPARLGWQQLFLDGRPVMRRPALAADLRWPPLSAGQWCFWQGRIYFRVAPGRLPGDYRPACCGLQTGITLYYVRDVWIRDLVVEGFQIDGVAVHDVVRDARLERVVTRGNGMSGISVRGASLVELDACHSADNGQSQLRIEDFARVWIEACRWDTESAPAIDRRGGELFDADAAILQ